MSSQEVPPTLNRKKRINKKRVTRDIHSKGIWEGERDPPTRKGKWGGGGLWLRIGTVVEMKETKIKRTSMHAHPHLLPQPNNSFRLSIKLSSVVVVVRCPFASSSSHHSVLPWLICLNGVVLWLSFLMSPSHHLHPWTIFDRDPFYLPPLRSSCFTFWCWSHNIDHLKEMANFWHVFKAKLTHIIIHFKPPLLPPPSNFWLSSYPSHMLILFLSLLKGMLGSLLLFVLVCDRMLGIGRIIQKVQ